MTTKIKKDLNGGEGNRLAPDAKLFAPTDGSHCERTTPLKTKMKQQLSAEDAGINPEREASTSRKRMHQEVKPI